jgi:CubicO group peptidase (beta-lactamase class C family)
MTPRAEHNGGTGDYNSYIGFDLSNQTAVVILSNLSPNFRIPATVMGIKLLVDLNAEEA